MGGRIYIADIDAANRISLKSKLSESNYDVIDVSDDPHLSERLVRERPDLIVLGADLPGKSLLAVLSEFKAHDRQNETPVLVVARTPCPGLRLAAFAAGVEDVLDLPVDEGLFLARIRRALRAHCTFRRLRERARSVASIGFHEGTPTFTSRTRLVLVSDDHDTATPLASQLADHMGASVNIVPSNQALRHLGNVPAPDVVLIASDCAADASRLVAELGSRPETRHVLCVLRYKRDSPESAIIAMDVGAREAVPDDIDPRELALRIGNHLKVFRHLEGLRKASDRGWLLATRDQLTGLLTRRAGLAQLENLSDRLRAQGQNFAVLFLDIDHFKRVNDNHGHAGGDAVLSEVARRIVENLANSALVVRYGGEEFLAALPDIDLAAANVAAERIRRAVEAIPVTLPGGASVSVTVSIGLSMGGRIRSPAPGLRGLIEQADRALYGAKAEGRNQVTIDHSPR